MFKIRLFYAKIDSMTDNSNVIEVQLSDEVWRSS